MTIPSPAVLHFRGGRKSISKQVYPDLDAFYRGSRQDLPQGGQGVLRRRLPLSAIRRHGLGLSLLAGRIEEGARARRQSRRPAGDLRPHHQLCDRRAAGRHDDHHACLPRQFPLDLDFVRRLRAGGARPCWPAPITTAISSNTIPSAPAASSRCAICRRATRSWWSASSPRRAAQLEKKDDIKRRLEEAAKFVPLDQLAVSPQCGFASTEEGNILTEEEQWAKLKLAVDVANEVWGT